MTAEWLEPPGDSKSDVSWHERLAEDVKAVNSEKSTKDLSSPTSVANARGRLVEAGLAADEILEMSAEEVVLRAMRYDYKVLQSDRKKWLLLPEHMQLQHASRLRDLGTPPDGTRGDSNLDNQSSYLAERLFEISAPVLTGVKTNALGCRRRFARLATIEAISDFAAVKGEMPDSFLDLQRLPAWPNPITGKPFLYKKLGPREAELTRSTDINNSGVGEKGLLRLSL